MHLVFFAIHCYFFALQKQESKENTETTDSFTNENEASKLICKILQTFI